jgi:predicted transcriptional regulator
MMSNEEWERKMDFLLNQQARFDAEMYELKEAQKKTDQRFAQTEEQISHLAGFMSEGFDLVMTLFKKTDAEIKELTESQKLTDEALRKLITRFDRHLSEDHPGLEH